MFDPNVFMNTTVAGPGSVELPQVGIGDYTAQITKLEPKEIPSEKSPTGTFPMLEVTWQPHGQTLTVRQAHFLDLLPDGNLDMSEGKNTSLNRVREVLGQNVGGWSPAMLQGGQARIRVGAGRNPRYNEVQGVASLQAAAPGGATAGAVVQQPTASVQQPTAPVAGTGAPPPQAPPVQQPMAPAPVAQPMAAPAQPQLQPAAPVQQPVYQQPVAPVQQPGGSF